MPESVGDRLGALLQGRRNAEACWALAVHLARCNAGSRLLEAFPASRRGFDGSGGLLELEGLSLSEKQIRNALLALEEVGYLVREIAAGNGWQRTSAGMRKAPVRYRFGPEFFPLFLAASRSRRRVRPDFTKGPRRADFVRSKITTGPLRTGSTETVTAPLSPKGFSERRVPNLSAPDPEKAAALATLARLKAAKDDPIPMASSALLASLGRTR